MKQISWLATAVVCLLLAACARDSAAMRDKCVRSGNKYFQNGRYKEASILYRRALQFDPKSAEAYYRLGMVQLALGAYVDAARSLERASSLDPNNEDATVRLAELYISAYVSNPQSNQRALQDAKPLVAQLLKRNPKSYGGLRLEADLATLDNDPEGAIRWLREADEIKPWQAEVVMPLMRNLAAAGQVKEAEKLGEEFLARDKTVRGVYDLLFVCYRQDSQLDRAEQTLKAEIANIPTDPLVRLELAAFYYSLNRRRDMQGLLEQLRASRKAFPNSDSLLGDFYLRIGEYDSAIQAYREGGRYQPARALEYEKKVANVLLAQGREQEALALVSKLHQDHPGDVEAAAIRAGLLAKSDPQQIEAAIGELESLVAKEPAKAMLQYHLGRAYWMKEEPASLAKAAQHFETTLKLEPDFLPAMLGLTRVRLAQGQNGVAVQMAEKILQSSPQNVGAKLLRATGLVNLGETQKARQELSSVLDLQKDSNDARYQIASLDLREKRWADAEAGFRALAQAGDGRGITGLADLRIAQGRPAAAAELLDQELAHHPDGNANRLALSEVLLQMGKFQEARAQLEQVVRRNPGIVDARIRLGSVDNRLGDKAAALENFEKAHQMQPSNPTAALGYALLLESAGRTEQAQAAYEDVLKIDPENATALNNLAYLKAEQGVDLDQALGYAQRALQRAPQDPNISDTLGLIYIRKKLTSQAVQVLRELVARVPDNPSFHLHLAMALYDAGEKEPAKKELEKALQHKPSAAEQAKIKELAARIG